MRVNGYTIEPGASLQGADLWDADLQGANLQGADLRNANLQGANLWGADLRNANLRSANLWGTDLWDADLRNTELQGADLWDADLQGADLRSAKLSGATIMPHGESWHVYLDEVVPALLTSGGKTLSEVATEETWACHTWTNCPIAVAFDVKSVDQMSVLLRPRAEEFIRFFDAGLIPLDAVQAKES